MSSINGSTATGRSSWSAEKPVRDMTLVEIAEQLERVTSWMEGERVKERNARGVYDAVRQEVDATIQEIRAHAGTLVQEQRRRMQSFDGMLGNRSDNTSVSEVKPQGARRQAAGRGGKKNITDAIIEIWDHEKYRAPLTTDEIADALGDVGYKTHAAPRSLKSAVNQTLAKLCKQGKIVKYRLDGSRISERDARARARRYMSARTAPD